MSNTTFTLQNGERVERHTHFDRLLVTWKGERGLRLHASVLQMGTWSPEVMLCMWDEGAQTGSRATWDGGRVDHDLVTAPGSTSYRIRLEGEGPCLVAISPLGPPTYRHFFSDAHTLLANFKGHSQMALNHARNGDLCLPTSLAAATSYLTGKPADPIAFATQTYDTEHDIFGNWTLGASQANTLLPKGMMWRACRLSSFSEIYDHLAASRPVVVTVKGELPGAPLPYKEGHVMVVIGWDGERVICMDPAFPSDEETRVAYPYADFIKAWRDRGQYAITLEETPGSHV